MRIVNGCQETWKFEVHLNLDEKAFFSYDGQFIPRDEVVNMLYNLGDKIQHDGAELQGHRKTQNIKDDDGNIVGWAKLKKYNQDGEAIN